MDLRHSVQQLDDNCVVAAAGSLVMWKYLKSYRALAQELGIRLAPEDDPSKAFSPKEAGEILGIEYNGTSMRWRIPVKKGDYILVALGKALRTRKILNIEAKRLSGKLQHYSEMVSGKFNRCLIIHLGKPDGEDEEEIVIKKQTQPAGDE